MRTDRQPDKWTDGQTDRQSGERTDGRTHGQIEGRTEGDSDTVQTHRHSQKEREWGRGETDERIMFKQVERQGL